MSVAVRLLDGFSDTPLLVPAALALIGPLMPKGLTWENEPKVLEVMPSCLAMSRRISEIVTFSITWSRPRIVSELMTRPPDPSLGMPPVLLTCLANPFAMSAARWASSAESTDPVRMMVSLIVRTWMAALGSAARRICVSSPMSRPMLISNEAISLPCLSSANSDVCPAAVPMR